jgi:hypothetical protein
MESIKRRATAPGRRVQQAVMARFMLINRGLVDCCFLAGAVFIVSRPWGEGRGGQLLASAGWSLVDSEWSETPAFTAVLPGLESQQGGLGSFFACGAA